MLYTQSFLDLISQTDTTVSSESPYLAGVYLGNVWPGSASAIFYNFFATIYYAGIQTILLKDTIHPTEVFRKRAIKIFKEITSIIETFIHRLTMFRKFVDRLYVTDMGESYPQLGPIYCGEAYFAGAPFMSSILFSYIYTPHYTPIYNRRILNSDVNSEILRIDTTDKNLNIDII